MRKWIYCTPETGADVAKLIDKHGFTEGNSQQDVLESYFICIDTTDKKFILSNTKGRGECLDTTKADWKPVLLEILTAAKTRTPLYPFRPKGEMRKYLDSYGKREGRNQSNTVAYIVQEFMKQNPL